MSLSESELARYARQTRLPELGEAGQEALKRSSVLVVGAGGLGSPVALYLAGAGIGRIGILDSDRVELSNLHRQVLHGTSAVGEAKVASAARRLGDANPEVAIETFETRLTSVNALDIIGRYDVVIDGTDNFPTRYLINDACVMLRKPNVYGSIFRFEGQASVFSSGDSPCYRCLYPDPPPPELVPSCEEGGVLGVLPGIIGTIQATETIKLLTGLGTTLAGRLLLFDALSMTFREIRLKRNRSCKVCGEKPTVTELIDYEEFCGVSNSNRDDAVMPLELADELRKKNRPRLIDVREPSEWASGHIEGAQLMPLGTLTARLHELGRDEDIVLYCRSGARSGRGVEMLRSAGYTKVRNLVGGILRWNRDVTSSGRG
jgi:adenylyltransferase/sulfurtransferase